MSNCPIVPVICARRRYRYIFEHPRILYLALFVIIIFPVSFPIWACASVNLNINMAANVVQEAREEVKKREYLVYRTYTFDFVAVSRDSLLLGTLSMTSSA